MNGTFRGKLAMYIALNFLDKATKVDVRIIINDVTFIELNRFNSSA